MHASGQELHGELSTSSAASGAAITLYRAGTDAVYTLADDEYIDIHFVQLVTNPGGDCYIHVGDSATLAAGETVVRGDFAANGGIATELTPHFAGGQGKIPYVTAPAGQVDVVIKATVRSA